MSGKRGVKSVSYVEWKIFRSATGRGLDVKFHTRILVPAVDVVLHPGTADFVIACNEIIDFCLHAYIKAVVAEVSAIFCISSVADVVMAFTAPLPAAVS